MVLDQQPQERLNRKIQRRNDVVGFPDRGSIIRLGAVRAEQYDEWAEGRRYPGLEALARAQAALIDTTTEKEDLTTTAGTFSA